MRSDSQIGRSYRQDYDIFCQFRSKLAITHTIAISWKEKHDAVVVDCHHSLDSYDDRMKMSLPKKKKFFMGRLPLLTGSNLGEILAPRATILP